VSEVFGWSFRKLIEVSASDAPTPGGGSVSAMVASLGTAMISMVANLTVGKEQYAAVEPEVRRILDENKSLLESLENLVVADMTAFEEFMRVLKLPKDTPEAKAERQGLLQQAYIKATDIPLEIAETCLDILKLADRLARIGNKGAISDVGVAAYVAEAALNAVLLSVEINLPGIKDQEYVAEVQELRAKLTEEAAGLKESALRQVRERM